LGQRTLFGLAKAFRRDQATFGQAVDPQEAFRLGTSLGRQGDVEGARSAYQQAIDSGDAEHAPAAGFQLGLLLGQHDDIDGAREAYRTR
jgi:TolA-binding protein